ncbi:Nuclear pore complex protein [Pleurotus pulmonarius]
MNSSPLLAELVVVREWLQETAPSPHHPEATTGFWKFTKHSIMQTLRSAGGQRDGLVKEMDPDVVNKGDGRALASDDANYEKSLANALYTYVRAGRLDEAIDLCRKAHQPWRAASICGSRLFQWKAIGAHFVSRFLASINLAPANEVSEDDDEVEEADAWQGNRRLILTRCNRRTWVCKFTKMKFEGL